MRKMSHIHSFDDDDQCRRDHHRHLHHHSHHHHRHHPHHRHRRHRRPHDNLFHRRADLSYPTHSPESTLLFLRSLVLLLLLLPRVGSHYQTSSSSLSSCFLCPLLCLLSQRWKSLFGRAPRKRKRMMNLGRRHHYCQRYCQCA